MATDRSPLVIESVKLVNFLTNNQLVQANAIIQKLEAMIQKIVMVPGSKPEEHPYWHAYHCAIRIRNYVLSGNTVEALKDAKELGRSI